MRRISVPAENLASAGPVQKITWWKHVLCNFPILLSVHYYSPCR